jgi:putative transposase
MTEQERENVMATRIRRGGTWRRPPLRMTGEASFLLTAACFNHAPILGRSHERMTDFENTLLTLLDGLCIRINAHVILPNHYHALVRCDDIATVRLNLGRLHGRYSRAWNLEEGKTGRKVFHGSAETRIKNNDHFFRSLNYVHHNPVKHGLVEKWTDWPWSSAGDYLGTQGEQEAKRIWREYPVDRFGETWDE